MGYGGRESDVSINKYCKKKFLGNTDKNRLNINMLHGYVRNGVTTTY